MPQAPHLPNFDTVTHKLQSTFGTIIFTANFSSYLLLFADYVCPFPGNLASQNFTRKKGDKVGSKNGYKTNAAQAPLSLCPKVQVKLPKIDLPTFDGDVLCLAVLLSVN